MAIQSNKGEMRIVLRVKDDGSAVIEKFGGTSEKTAKKSGKAFDDFSSGAGVNFRSLAGYAGLAAAAIVGIGASMVASSIQTAAAAGKLAETLRTTTEEVSKLNYAAGLLGNLTEQEVAYGLTVMTRALSDAAQGVGDARYALLDLGLDAQKLAKMRPEQAIEAISAQLAQVPNQADRARIAQDLFRGSSEKWVRALQGGPGALRAAYEEAERFGKIISTETAVAANKFNDDVLKLKANLEGMANTIAGPVIKALAKMTSEMMGTESLDQLMDRRAELAQSFTNLGQILHLDPQFAKKRREQLLKDIDEVDAKIIAANKRMSANLAGAGAKPEGATGDAPGGNSRQREEFKQLMADLRLASITAQADITQDEMAAAAIRVEATRAEWTQKIEQMRLGAEQRKEFEVALAQFLATQTEAGLGDREKRRDEERKDAYERFTALRGSLDERFATQEEARKRQLDLDNYYNTFSLERDAEYTRLREQIEIERQAKLGDAQAKGILQRQALERMTTEQQVGFYFSTLESVTRSAAQHNKKMFELNKVAAIGNAIVSTYQGAAAAMKWGWPMGPIFAAIMVAAGMANVRAIASTKFGQTTAAPSVNAGNAMPVQPVSAQPSSVVNSRTDEGQEPVVTQIIINGFVGTQEFLDGVVIPAIQRATNDRDVMLFTNNSRQARELQPAT